MVLDNPHHLMVVTSLVIMPMSFFCGIFIPVTDLPNWAQPIIGAIPLTVAVQTARAIALSTGTPHLWQNLAYIITFTIAVFLIGLYLFKKKVIK
jgi:ABC-type multidrug transport system permease subunit